MIDRMLGSRWRLCVDPPRSGAANMQLDESLLAEVDGATVPVTVLRFYQWTEPTVSLGKHQRAERAADIEYCREHAIPVVQRPTGGRAVLHADELTYAVVSNDSTLFPLHNVHQTYRVIALALQRGLRNLGIISELAPGCRETAVTFRTACQTPCFVTPSRHELVVNGRKIAGSAQRRFRRSFLQHGSIPLQIDYGVMARTLGVPEAMLRSTMISVCEAAGRVVSFEQLCAALRQGFAEAFRVCW